MLVILHHLHVSLHTRYPDTAITRKSQVFLTEPLESYLQGSFKIDFILLENSLHRLQNITFCFGYISSQKLKMEKSQVRILSFHTGITMVYVYTSVASASYQTIHLAVYLDKCMIISTAVAILREKSYLFFSI